MKVQYLLTIPQIRAISLLTHIDGTFMHCDANDRRLIEYDITSDQHCMLDSLLSQTGFVIKEKPQWPSEGDKYYYIDNDGEILTGRWDTINDVPSCVDARRRNIGNIFKTEEEAQFKYERLKVLNQLKSLSDDDWEWNKVNSHYYIAYDLDREKFDIWSFSFTKLPCNIYFKTKASAEAAIKTIGEDKLKKYVFGIEE